MSTTALRELLRPYLPIWLRERIGVAALLPGDVFSCQATILYADLSGFTRLTAAFADLPDGAERLYESLNRLYSALVEAILLHDGDVVSIAGDALTAWWPEQVDLDLGLRCGEAMVAALAALPEIETPLGPFRIDLRVGVAAGSAQAALAGLSSHGVHLVLTGPAVIAATVAERTTAPGTTSVVPLAPGTFSLETIRTNDALTSSTEAMVLSEEHFLPPTFVERLRLDALVAEYRRCVPVFAAFELPDRPEELHSLVARAQAIILRWGGWLNEVEVGDKGSLFVLLFGAPVAHGDDATRAVGCCIELRERGLITQAAITAGTLFVGAVGSSHRRVYSARGDEMNLAAHLMHRAKEGDILVSSRIRDEISGRYWVDPAEEWIVKGHAYPIPVARISAAQPDTRTAMPQPSAPLIGREQERLAVRQAMLDVLGGSSRLLLIEGEAGIGKTTLLQDLLAHWIERGLEGLIVSNSSGGQATPLRVWRGLIGALLAAGNWSGSSVERLQHWLDDENATVPDDLPWLLRSFIALRLAAGPLLLCIEDVHWADERSLQVLAELFANPLPKSAHPLFVALSYRPVAAPTVAPLQRLPQAVAIQLKRLNDYQSEEMMRLMLGASSIEAHLAYDVYTHTDGQPLFIKESLLALRQRNLITIDERGHASLSRTETHLHASDSALDIVQAAVDRLDEASRLTLKVAAVIGRSFPLRLLQSIHPAQLDEAQLKEHLALLTRFALVELEFDIHEQVYRFKYQVTHDVAYTSLLFGQRRALHAAVVRWYEQTYAEEVTNAIAPLAMYDVLIEHLRLAEETSARVRYCHAAALTAARQYAHTTALNYIDQALPLTTDLMERFALLLLRVAINDRWGNQFTQAEHLSTLEVIAEQLAEPLLMAHTAFYKTRYLLAMGLYQTALTSGQRANVLSRQAQQQAKNEEERHLALLLRAGCVDACGMAKASLGQYERATQLHRRALFLCRIPLQGSLQVLNEAIKRPIASLFDLAIGAVQFFHNLGSISFKQDQLDTAETFFERSLEAAREGRDWIGEGRAREQLGRIALARQDYQTARTAAESALATAQASGDRLGQCLAMHQLSAIHRAQGNLSEAQRVAILAQAMSASIGARALEARILLDIAGIAEAQGLDEEAEAARQEAERARGAWWRTETPSYLSVAVG
jgi:class 3 adenylate cyclase/tetratricopeptide (TPR) repeat protein